MLRAKSIPAFLEQANTDGMRATMLLQVGCWSFMRTHRVF